jgi:hypothetical protein
MSTIIKLKNSGVSGSPSALATGELAYSFLTGTLTNGGDRLFIGTGAEDALTGAAANIEVIGGKYFTSKLDHALGTLTASSALLVDANSKIDVFNVDNLRLDGNTISSTDANGAISVVANGTGTIGVSTLGTINLNGATINITGAANYTGNLDVTGTIHATGTLNIDGVSTLASAVIEDLTSGRITFAGTGGALVDSANLTFNGTSLIVGANKFTVAHATGNTGVAGTLDVTGLSTLATARVSDLTATRVTFAGTAGRLSDSADMTFTGAGATSQLQLVGKLNVDAQTTLASLNVEDLTATRVVYVGASGELVDSTDMVFTGAGATSQLQLVGKLNVDAQASLASLNVEDLTSGRVLFAGTSGELVDSSAFTYNTSTANLVLTGDLDITGSADIDNININGNTISSTDTNGNIVLAPNALGVTNISSATALKIPVGNTASRPGVSSAGMIRFNTTDTRYEAYDGTNWTGLGGVIDVDQNTFIRAETTPGANNNDLEFYTDGTKRVNLDENGMVFTDTTIPLQVGKIKILNDTISTTSGGVMYLDPNPSGSAGSVVIEGNLTINGTTTTVNSTVVTVDDPIFILGGDTSLASPDGMDKGILFQWHNGTAAKQGFFGYDSSANRFTFVEDATNASEVISGAAANVKFGNALIDSLTFTSGNYTTTSILATNGSGGVTFVNEDAANVFGVTGQVLQMNGSGVPSFGHINCGTY